jgi:hypothetical protein
MSALARIKKTAAQHEQERQYEKALALYARLLDGAGTGEEEADVALFNRAGDLALRLGDAARAVGYFERALDLYAAAGLLNNAVALGVKILRTAPHHLSAHYTLGVLYARKGFVGDARHHLLTYAVQMERAGRVDESGRVLAEVAATCAGVAELRAAYDAYSALGGDPAHAAPLAPGATPVATAAELATAAAEPEFLDLTVPGDDGLDVIATATATATATAPATAPADAGRRSTAASAAAAFATLAPFARDVDAPFAYEPVSYEPVMYEPSAYEPSDYGTVTFASAAGDMPAGALLDLGEVGSGEAGFDFGAIDTSAIDARSIDTAAMDAGASAGSFTTAAHAVGPAASAAGTPAGASDLVFLSLAADAATGRARPAAPSVWGDGRTPRRRPS